MNDSDLAEFVSSALPVFDELASGSRRLIRLPAGLPVASNDLQQLAPLDSRKQLTVEKIP